MQIYENKIFSKPIQIIKAFDEKSFIEAFKIIETYRKKYYLLGYIKYEAKNFFLNKNYSDSSPILYFEVYENYSNYLPKEPQNIDIAVYPNILKNKYYKNIEKIKTLIEEGFTYEVNYTYSNTLECNSDDLSLYEFLLTRQKTPYNTFIKNEYETLLSFSPELFFKIKNGKIETKPMKGTVNKGEDEKENIKNTEFLKNDEKNLAENVMIVDLLRNDLSKIAKTGSVNVPKLFEIEEHKTLYQMTSTVTAELKDETSLYDVLEAIFPCGSITGAPKISTMEIIENIEQEKRNIYCGAIGFISPEETIFSVPIRILQRKNTEKNFTYNCGGAIVWDSEAEDEWQETIIKKNFLNTDFELIETMLAQNGKILLFDEHIKRLENSAKIFGFKIPDNLKSFKPTKDGMVRLLLSKIGNIRTEYKDIKSEKTDIISISKNTINSKNPFLYHKTTKRFWYNETMEKIKNGEVFDEIFFNEKGEVTEGARSNIVIEKNGILYTPPTKCGLLAGTFRQSILHQLTEKILYKKDLIEADKIYALNSVRGKVEVKLNDNN